MNMIEKVAKAMYVADYKNNKYYSAEARQAYLIKAKAAIEAMRPYLKDNIDIENDDSINS